MKVKIKKLHPDAVIPKYAKNGDAGMDLTAISKEAVSEDHGEEPYIEKTFRYWEYKTGLSVEIPKGYVGLIFPRSSISNTGLSLANSVGVIDSGYRGEISFRFYNCEIPIEYDIGDRVGQLMIIPYPEIEFEEVQELEESERGTDGFGSTNKPY